VRGGVALGTTSDRHLGSVTIVTPRRQYIY
jgi:hypothetical protein